MFCYVINSSFFTFLPQQIMSDKWMNLGYDNQDLKPYCEPIPDFKDERRIGESCYPVVELRTAR